MPLVRRYPLTAFFVLACALSWWPWILYSVGLLPNPIVGFGPFPRGAGRAGSYRGQKWRDGVTATDGALARRAPMVCRGASASYRGHPCFGSAQRLLAGRSAHVLSGRFGWLVNSLAAVFALAPHPWSRWHLGGAGLQRVRPAPAAIPVLGTPSQPDPRGAVGLLAPAVRGNRGRHLD
jgi:hypothetical protein